MQKLQKLQEFWCNFLEKHKYLWISIIQFCKKNLQFIIFNSFLELIFVTVDNMAIKIVVTKKNIVKYIQGAKFHRSKIGKI